MRRLVPSRRSLTTAVVFVAALTPLSGGRISTFAAVIAAADDDGQNGPPGPCEQGLKAKGNAHGLDRRCEAAGGGGVARGDFNGDGIADLAVGVPFEDQDGVGSVGGVNVIYGSASGLTSTGDQFLDATTFGLSYTTDANFGWALASGDFNGDDRSDLAIGMPGASVGGKQFVGRVLIIDGSPTGLNTATARNLPLLSGPLGSAGSALVWADFNGDTFGDLAIGIPGADIGSCSFVPKNEGEVQVFYGSAAGLTSLGAQRIRQGSFCFATADDSSLLLGSGRNAFENLGTSLAAGNFNGDSLNGNPISDLAIGVPFDVTGAPLGLLSVFGGRVHVLAGSAGGLKAAQSFTQDSPGIGGGAEDRDEFGHSLAVGDFNADLHDDLAIGVPFEDLLDNTAADAGAVHILLGSFNPGELVTTVDSLFISQTNLSGTSAEAGDRFGWALTAGRFDDDFQADLAIGSPGEDINSIVNAGIVQVLYGSARGPSLTRTQIWHQNTANIPDAAETGDQFGYALSAWNYGEGSQSDLAIGVPFEDLLSASTGTQQADAGAVIVIYGASSGLAATSTTPAELWHQDTAGINDSAQVGDQFGFALY
jgi:hypothetical protein